MQKRFIPQLGRLPMSPHAQDRMVEREVTEEDIGKAIAAHRHRWNAALVLACTDAVRVTLGGVVMVLGPRAKKATVITVYRA